MGRNEAAQGTVPLLSIRNIYKSFGLNAVLKGISLDILPGEVLAETDFSDTARIRDMYDSMVLPSIPKGLCGCVYTQLSDVEGETNGLYTYDRAVRKADQEVMLDIAARVGKALAQAVENG